jgi:hypothetical protein
MWTTCCWSSQHAWYYYLLQWPNWWHKTVSICFHRHCRNRIVSHWMRRPLSSVYQSFHLSVIWPQCSQTCSAVYQRFLCGKLVIHLYARRLTQHACPHRSPVRWRNNICPHSVVLACSPPSKEQGLEDFLSYWFIYGNVTACLCFKIVYTCIFGRFV